MENWKEIPGISDRYAVSRDGQVRNTTTGQVLSQHLNKDGYPRTNLYVTPGKQKPFEVHRLVALAWHDNPNGLATVNHIDGNKRNNAVDNLEWASQADNNAHALRIGLRPPRKGVPANRPNGQDTRPKTVEKLDAAGKIVARYESARQAAIAEGIPRLAMQSACKHNKPIRGIRFQYSLGEVSKLTADTCYLPNAQKFLRLGFAVDEPDAFGRRVYSDANAIIAVDADSGASGEVTIWGPTRPDALSAIGRKFTGLLPSEAFFDQLLIAVGWRPAA